MTIKKRAISIVLIVALISAVLIAIGFINKDDKSVPSDKSETVTQLNVPILLYHHIADEGENDTVISKEKFEHQLSLMSQNGYSAVTFDDLISFVENGTPLPDKPVVITFDDGYTSNYDIAYPLLKKYNFKATIFLIGKSIGKSVYKDTDYQITPHFGGEEIAEMDQSGIISFHSHTYDMHQWQPYESTDIARETVLPFEGETAEAYTEALTQDVTEQNRVFAQNGLEPSIVFSFPKGKTLNLANDILLSLGYKVTCTTDETKINTLVKGDASTLVDMGRKNICADTTDEQLIEYLSQKKGTS